MDWLGALLRALRGMLKPSLLEGSSIVPKSLFSAAIRLPRLTCVRFTSSSRSLSLTGAGGFSIIPDLAHSETDIRQGIVRRNFDPLGDRRVVTPAGLRESAASFAALARYLGIWS